MSFKDGLLKTASAVPEWFLKVHKSMQPNRSTKNFSKKGIKGLLTRRGVK